ncbi:MAG: DUF1217 domain-containing protein [Rhodobacteraceae bacterium]|nr:DUF1217 domain-containing protein [Paracoccaceae bacterium]
MFSTSASFRLISTNLQRSLDTVAQQPVASREIEHYKENIANIKSIDDFMADDRVFRFAMKAFGLEEMSYAKGLIRKLLEQGTEDQQSLSNQLVDPRYRDLAKTFDFVRFDTATTSFSDATTGTVDRYIRQSLEEDAGSTNEGVRLALYFERKAADLNGPFDVLGDRALLQVVQTATGISPASATQPIDKQAKEITKRIDLADLKDPVKLEEFLTRFTTLWELDNPSSPAGANQVAMLQPAAFGIDVNTLMNLQNIKYGGG